jgi:DNA-binding transcriptional LysR family regulator
MSRPTLDPDLLRAFVAVVDQRSFTRAATVLNRTQSAVSSQIKRLEDQVGQTLLDRSTTHVDVTPAGESLVGYARRILSLGEEAIQRLHEHEVEGRVRLGVMEDYGTIHMPGLLKSFALAYPAVEIQMETGLTSTMVERIGSDFDIVIAMHPAGERSGTLLSKERAIWVGSHLLDVNASEPLPLALYHSGCLFRKWALEALDRSGRAWRLAFISHSLSAVEAVAAQGLAVTVVKEGTRPSSLTVLGKADGLPKLPLAEIRLHTASPLSPAGRFLADHIRTSWRSAPNLSLARG